MKIPVVWLKEGGIICLETCPYSRTCANHDTAGDFRTEDGFTPVWHRDGQKIDCATSEQPPAPGSNYRGESYPETDAGYGSIFLDKGKELRVYTGPYGTTEPYGVSDGR